MEEKEKILSRETQQ